MRHAWLLCTGLALSGALFAGCSGGGGGGGSTSGDANCLESLSPVTNEAFCAADAVQPDCSRVTGVYKVQACGVALTEPPGELARSSNVKEFGGSGPPQLDCFLPSGYPAPPGTSMPVTLRGVAQIFSHGCESKELEISVHTVKRTGGEDDGDLDGTVGAYSTVADCKVAGAGVTSEDEDCGGNRYECFYAIDGIPSETELVIKTDGAQWAPLYEYGVFIPTSELTDVAPNPGQPGDGKTGWDHDVRALAQDDYTVIPQAAFGGTVPPGKGVIAGEVHDCGNVRLINAVADVDADKVITTYFTDVEDHPLPQPDRDGTSSLGLYAAMGIEAGPVTVAAGGLVNGGLVSVGFFRARIFPDSVTSVTFRGLKPFQLPKE